MYIAPPCFLQGGAFQGLAWSRDGKEIWFHGIPRRRGARHLLPSISPAKERVVLRVPPPRGGWVEVMWSDGRPRPSITGPCILTAGSIHLRERC